MKFSAAQAAALADRLRASGLFDEAFYRASNPDVAAANVDPIRHYIEFGASELRDPHPLFDTSWYLDKYPDVAQASVNPLAHYLRHGGFEGRDPHPDFDSDWYLSAHPEAAAAHINPLVHFIAGLARGPAAGSAGTAAKQASHKPGSFDLEPGAAHWVRLAYETDRIRDLLLQQSERTGEELDRKLRELGDRLGQFRIGRAAIFREMARLARKRGSEVIAATYCLRLMTWLGNDRYGDLPFVTDTLKRHHLNADAETAIAMFEDPGQADVRCRTLLDRQAAAHRTKPDLPLAVFEDRRRGAEVKVSVIVSLYNAEDKLPGLLDNLSKQSMAKHRRFEIVLVDSGSPSAEYRVFKEFAAASDIPIAYARSEKRETIQAAWNRGIKLAHAPYLCFLGVDEGLYPDGLDVLASSLDARPDVDWVMADSHMIEVDSLRRHVADGWRSDRTGHRRQLIQLDSSYLAYVGGMYRTSIHARFGYYDEAFRAAGDTEFKARMLRHIKTLHVPKLLGVHFNFPDQRATDSAIAEIEDLRAWCLHRTKAGIAYCYEDMPIDEAKELLRLSLGHRKATTHHISTDFDMAIAAAGHLSSRPDQDQFARNAAKAAERMLGMIREIELLDYDAPPAQRAMTMENILRTGKALQSLDAASLGLDKKPIYDFFNDNRFEQCCWAFPPSKWQ